MFENETKDSRIVKAFLNQLLQKSSSALSHDDGQELIISLMVLNNICTSQYVCSFIESKGIIKPLLDMVRF